MNVTKSKKILNFLIFLLSLLIILSFLFVIKVKIDDELWNYQSIYKMTRGLKIYNDINVIITPLFFYLAKIFMFISNKLVVLRLFNIFIIFGLLFSIKKLFEALKIKETYIYVFTPLIILQIFPILTVGANYNLLAIVFFIYGIYLFIADKATLFNQALMITLIFFTKQNLGFFYGLGTVIYDLLNNKFSFKVIINQAKKVLLFVILSLIPLGFLYFNGNLFGFINYCFGGLFEFSNDNLYFSPGVYDITIFVIPLLLFLLAKSVKTIKNYISEDIHKNLNTLFIFKIMITSLIYPLANPAHFCYASIFDFIIIFYFFYAIILDEILEDVKDFEYIAKVTCIFVQVVIIIRIMFYALTLSACTYITDTTNPFYGLPVKTNLLETSDKIIDFMNLNKDYTIIIIDSSAALTNIRANSFHQAFDLPFNGNLGYNGTEKMINDIKNMKNVKFLILTDAHKIFTQESKPVREYIINNLALEGTLDIYSIYSK